MVTSVTLDPDIRSRLERLAKARHRPAESLAQEAIREFVDRAEQQARLRGETLAAWAEQQETGLHLTHDEVDAWLARLEAGEDLPPPECHR